jgi:hypothetical protein
MNEEWRMSNIWFIYWWVIFLPIIIAQQTEARRRRQMGPRVQVEPSEFLRMIAQEKGLVIKSRKFPLQGTTYVSRCGDYYYYTMSKEPLALPDGCVVQQAKNILL